MARHIMVADEANMAGWLWRKMSEDAGDVSKIPVILHEDGRFAAILEKMSWLLAGVRHVSPSRPVFGDFDPLGR